MVAIAICCDLLIDYGARKAEAEGILMLVLPLLVSISFFLVADIDSPLGEPDRDRCEKKSPSERIGSMSRDARRRSTPS